MSEPILSIVTGTLDRPESIKACIKSVLEFTDIPYELIVADAGSRPIELVPLHPPQIKLMREWPREGHAKGYNKAFRTAKGKYVCWLNDDARCTPNWARNAVAFMEHYTWCGLGAFYYSEHGSPYHVNDYQDMIYANFGILSREFGNEIGWFDECVRMYGADNSITFKTILAGRGVCGMPDARLIHLPFVDQQRIENVAGQKRDEMNLLNKYKQYVPQMQTMMKRYPHSPLRVH